MRACFPLFQSHLDLAHYFWRALLQPGDTCIDATCGNGRDTLMLANLCVASKTGKVIAVDIQQDAIENTQKLLKSNLPDEMFARIQFYHGTHAEFSKEITNESVRLIIYNLGYLPGGNKSLTTRVESTLQSITYALDLIMSGGAISVTCYPGHEEGRREEEALLNYATALNPLNWSCTHQRWLNRKDAPSLLIMQKAT